MSYDAQQELSDLQDSILHSFTLSDFQSVKKTVEMTRSLPKASASKRFSEWVNQGPKLAKAAGCHVGITVSEAK